MPAGGIGIDLVVKVKGPFEKTKTYQHTLPRNAKSALNVSARELRTDIRRGLPRGMRKDVAVEAATISKQGAAVKSLHPLNAIIEKGTRAHVIAPKNRQSSSPPRPPALAFGTRGGVVVVRRVHHPGTKGRHAWEKGQTGFLVKLNKRLKAAVEAALQGKSYDAKA